MRARAGLAAMAALLVLSPASAADDIFLTAGQSNQIERIQSIAVLVSVPDSINVQAPENLCADVRAITDWGFKRQIEEDATRVLSTRLAIVPKAYDGAALRWAPGIRGTKRSGLPSGDDIDAFIVVSGNVD